MIKFNIHKEQGESSIDARLVQLIKIRIAELFNEFGNKDQISADVSLLNGILKIEIDKARVEIGKNIVHEDRFRNVVSLDDFRGVQKKKSISQLVVDEILKELPSLIHKAGEKP